MTAKQQEVGVMFRNVVWATDGSKAANEALVVARNVVGDGGRLVAVHCAELLPPGRGGGPFPVSIDQDEISRKIEGQVAELREAGMQAEAHFAPASAGGAAQVVADVATEVGADVIVAGTRGHTALGGLLLGSVTQRLLHIAPCPVLVVPART